MSAGQADLTAKGPSVDFPMQSGIQWDVSHMAHDPFLFA
jgi:hypothetical protein